MSVLWRGFPQLQLHLHPEPHSDSFTNFWLDKIGRDVSIISEVMVNVQRPDFRDACVSHDYKQRFRDHVHGQRHENPRKADTGRELAAD
jgi:hypothetical protein